MTVPSSFWKRGGAALVLLIAAAMSSALPQARVDETETALRGIFDEVRTMPARPGELFIRQEFFIGKDDDDTFKDIAVSIVLPEEEKPPLMIVQFTWMDRDRRDRRTATARSTKILRCVMEADGVRLKGDSFDEEELAVLARGLLKAVQDKKRLLRKTPSGGPAGISVKFDYSGVKVLYSGPICARNRPDSSNDASF